MVVAVAEFGSARIPDEQSREHAHPRRVYVPTVVDTTEIRRCLPGRLPADGLVDGGCEVNQEVAL